MAFKCKSKCKSGSKASRKGIPQDRLSDNAYLTDLQIDKLPDPQKIDLLLQIMDNELAKPESDADMTLVDACLAYMEDLGFGENKSAMDGNREEALAAGLGKIQEKAHILQGSHLQDAEPGDAIPAAPVAVPKRRNLCARILRISAIAAVLLLGVFGSLTVAAKVSGFDNAVQWLEYHFEGKQETPVEEQNGVTVIAGEEEKEYPSVEEWLREADLPLLYPTVLPEGIEIECVEMTFYNEDQYSVDYRFTSRSVRFSVYNFNLSYYQGHDEYGGFEERKKIKIDGREFEITRSFGYQATYVTDGYAYVIQAESYEDLLTLLRNLRGI